MTTHLRVSTYYNDEHPLQSMERLGITYQHATPQSMLDEWWFWNCENVPDQLPEYFSILECKDPLKMLGWGLSKENAEKIRDYLSTSKQKQKFYRVVDYPIEGASTKVYFEPTLELALRHVEGMELQNVCLEDEPNWSYRRTIIQPFMAYTCDFDGWANPDFENYEVDSYVLKLTPA